MADLRPGPARPYSRGAGPGLPTPHAPHSRTTLRPTVSRPFTTGNGGLVWAARPTHDGDGDNHNNDDSNSNSKATCVEQATYRSDTG
jgi:hypothetical protein